MKNLFLIVLTVMSLSAFSQRNEVAWNKAKEAIKLMDEGKIDESIALLKECEKLDGKDHTYPYEIAYAHALKKDYKTAIAILDKTKKYKNASSQIYQLSGNCYSYLEKPELAIKEYEEGMKKFPDAGNLHLEKGNIFLQQKKYNEAVENYERGIQADPEFPSNYYRLALLYLGSTDKLSGLIYGEIFMNLERTSTRTQEISELLFDTYKQSIQFNGDETKIDFCEIVIDAKNIKGNDIKLPLCASFGKNFLLSIIGQKEINLTTLSEIRIGFIKNFFMEDYKKYPNVLFEYHKTMLDQGVFDAYNKYILQVGAGDEFATWKNANTEKYDAFVEWYTNPDNYLKINGKNKFIRE
ncbi:tetratricopeptide repeat protein [Flavobacterium amniphilum]|uniref:tetratricopeptide repeat protein n=1 Tax=Flavobacterium amniphilum TaxID=1834035 RepID=UPI00202A7328|nr:tetratricopeptide repeat protein [Flavobacterium amniphilum]MCL9806551.1 tetratricopeptide repeat protein [Flavobacterium amniphilum]